MGDPLSRLATRIAYAARQLPRMAWYAGHLYVMRQLAELQEGERDPTPPKPEPDPRLDRRLENDMMALLEQDLVNAGIYPVPADHDGSLLTLLDRSRLFFRDLPEVHARRERNATREVLNSTRELRHKPFMVEEGRD